MRECVQFVWEDDWSLDHQREFDCYEDGGPQTCEVCLALDENGNVLTSLSCIDDATDEYRSHIERELAADCEYLAEQELGRQRVDALVRYA